MECDWLVIYFLPGPILMFIGWILQVVSISTSHWSVDRVSNVGLWEMCRELSPADDDRDCFKFSKRDHLPMMPFICSALAIVSLVILTFSTIWSVASVFQTKSRASRWQRKSGMISIIAVVFNLFCVCLYGASYDTISYSMIPKWSGKYNMRLSWSFTVCCVSVAISLLGATLSVVLAFRVKELTHLPPMIPTTPHAPSLHIHPPPSSRLSTPSRFIHATNSPLPFGRGRFVPPKYPKMTPVHVT
ncbi:hypothetical protein FSP39_015628 [Pinctada imbricata]|uniref:Uncharacterized protein n=1 Tax=Pinctada imbricata TaxID=66713 RepID=A0AA89BS38_PINIB|nr:hypothetical protein FSP39_015628 [Pinctada imbricata]